MFLDKTGRSEFQAIYKNIRAWWKQDAFIEKNKNIFFYTNTFPFGDTFSILQNTKSGSPWNRERIVSQWTGYMYRITHCPLSDVIIFGVALLNPKLEQEIREFPFVKVLGYWEHNEPSNMKCTLGSGYRMHW